MNFKCVALKVHKYTAMFSMTLQSTLAYVWDSLFRQLFLVVVMFVFVQLWKTTYAFQGTTTIAGMTIQQIIWYLAFSESITSALVQVGADIDAEVKSGSIAYFLTKPYSYSLMHYARYMGQSVFRFFLSLAVACTVAGLCVGVPPLDPAAGLTGLIAFFLGATIDYWIQLCIGLGAFWMEDTWSLRFLYSRLNLVLGGTILPLDLFPNFLQKIVKSLPNSKIVYGPSRLFISRGTQGWAELFASQILWIAAVSLAACAIFRIGTKRVSIQGG